jgi:hypothetical protein
MHQILGSNNKALQQSSNLKKPQEYINNNNGVETTTSIKQKWSKYLNQYNFKKKNTTPLALITTKGIKLRKMKCEE